MVRTLDASVVRMLELRMLGASKVRILGASVCILYASMVRIPSIVPMLGATPVDTSIEAMIRNYRV